MRLIRGVLGHRKGFVKKGTESHFPIFIENWNCDLKSVFLFDNGNEKRKYSKFYFLWKQKPNVPFDPQIWMALPYSNSKMKVEWHFWCTICV